MDLCPQGKAINSTARATRIANSRRSCGLTEKIFGHSYEKYYFCTRNDESINGNEHHASNHIAHAAQRD
jgi:hypothetical protein